MTASIDDERRMRALRPPEPAPADLHHPHRLMVGVRIFSLTSALAGIACLSAALAGQNWRAALAGSTLLTISAIASSLWIAEILVADRRAFYERGKADGWYAGWRGMPPDPDDPFLRF